MNFVIDKMWNSEKSAVTYNFRIEPCVVQPGDLVVSVDAPFFNAPISPHGPPGEAFQQLWEYEVFEVFFLGLGEQYLEVELCPHGQHLVLQLRGARGLIRDMLPLEFSAQIDGSRWRGNARITADLLPPGLFALNAYAIYGSGPLRTYLALFPATAPHDAPDFHRLQYFQALDAAALPPSTRGLGAAWPVV